MVNSTVRPGMFECAGYTPTMVFPSTPLASILQKLTFPVETRARDTEECTAMQCAVVGARVMGTRGMGGGGHGADPRGTRWYGSGWSSSGDSLQIWWFWCFPVGIHCRFGGFGCFPGLNGDSLHIWLFSRSKRGFTADLVVLRVPVVVQWSRWWYSGPGGGWLRGPGGGWLRGPGGAWDRA